MLIEIYLDERDNDPLQILVKLVRWVGDIVNYSAMAVSGIAGVKKRINPGAKFWPFKEQDKGEKISEKEKRRLVKERMILANQGPDMLKMYRDNNLK